MSVTGNGVVADKAGQRLRSNALGLIEAIGQSLAAISPTLTPVLNITVVAGLARIGCWRSYFIGTNGVVIASARGGPLAARHREAGSYFVYVGRTFGPFAGALAGWAMISAYLFTAIAVSLSFAILLGNFLGAFGVKTGTTPLAAAMLVFVAAVTYAAYRDIRLSSRVGLVLEIISVSIIVGITVLVARAQGTVIDPGQLSVAAFKWGPVF